MNCVLASVAVVLLGVVGPLVGNLSLSNVITVVISLLTIALLEARMWALAHASIAAAASSEEAPWGRGDEAVQRQVGSYAAEVHVANKDGRLGLVGGYERGLVAGGGESSFTVATEVTVELEQS